MIFSVSPARHPREASGQCPCATGRGRTVQDTQAREPTNSAADATIVERRSRRSRSCRLALLLDRLPSVFVLDAKPVARAARRKLALDRKWHRKSRVRLNPWPAVGLVQTLATSLSNF